MKIYKLGREELAYFRDRIQYWRKKLGLSNQEFYACWEDEDDNESRACYIHRSDHAMTTVYLNRVWRSHPSKKQLDQSAFHEVFEAGYFGKLRGLAFRSFNEGEVNEATHHAVRSAENSIFKELR